MRITTRVRVLNFFRNIFKIPFLERALAGLTLNKSPQYFFCRFVPNPYQYPSGSRRTIKRSGLRLQVDISDYIGHLIYFGFRDVAMDNLFKLCNPGYNVIDVGTNIGWTLLNFGKLVAPGKVIGFEPDPLNYENCRNNLMLNQLPNVKVLAVGLGDKESEVQLEVRTPGNRGGNRVSATAHENAVPVMIKRLDSVSEVTSLDTVHLIKLDVEGYELHVLRGAIELLQKHKPILFIEVDDHNLRDQGNSALALIIFLEELGYSSVMHAETGQAITRSFEFVNCHFDVIACA